MQFYIGTSAVVATAHGNTENFSTTSGVLQGDTLAPFLFISLLDYILCETLLNNVDGLTITPRRSLRYPAVQIGALMYADDIAITCDTIDQAKNVFLHLKMTHKKLVSRSTNKPGGLARWTYFSAEANYNDKWIYS